MDVYRGFMVRVPHHLLHMLLKERLPYVTIDCFHAFCRDAWKVYTVGAPPVFLSLEIQRNTYTICACFSNRYFSDEGNFAIVACEYGDEHRTPSGGFASDATAMRMDAEIQVRELHPFRPLHMQILAWAGSEP